MDLTPVIHHAGIRVASCDGLGGGAVYSQPGAASVRVTSTSLVPRDGVQLIGWWADRCRVDLFGVGSESGTTLRLALICGNSCEADSYVTLFSRTVAVPAKTLEAPLKLTLGVGSGWLGAWWALLGSVAAPGDVAVFSARYTLDRAGAGLYTAFGDGTGP